MMGSSLRGLVYMEVFASAAAFDLLSGQFGGAVPNPADALCAMLAPWISPYDPNAQDLLNSVAPPAWA